MSRTNVHSGALVLRPAHCIQTAPSRTTTFFQKANMTSATVAVYDGHVSTAFLTFMSGTLRDHGCRASFAS